MTTSKIFLIWKDDSHNGTYIPIGCLEKAARKYTFQYVKGLHVALRQGFTILPDFPRERETYTSAELFPLFSNRLMSRGRKNFSDYLRALHLISSNEFLPELARSGGVRTTDRFRVFEMPVKKRGRFTLTFFAVGLTRSPVAQNLEELRPQLQEGKRLLLTPQVQNPHDSKAVMLHTENNDQVGWLPRYFASELQPLLLDDPRSLDCRVLRFNYPLSDYAPDILLVRLQGKWPAGWMPFQKDEFELLSTARTKRIA